MTGVFLVSLSLYRTTQGQGRKTWNIKSSATVHISEYIHRAVTFCPKVTLRNVFGENCTLALIVLQLVMNLSRMLTQMCVSTATTVYPSPENQRKATISLSVWEGIFIKKK